MSGTQSALFGGGSRWISNPKQLNRLAALNTRLQLKTAFNTLIDSSAAGFFTALALRGAQASISVADTYVTVASLSGSGFLVNCVSPTHTAAFTPTFRITVDGTQYILSPSAAQTLAWRMVLGPTISGGNTAAGDATFVNSSLDNGFQAAQVGGLVQMGAATVLTSLPTPETVLSLGLQALRFESSLLVEMKCDLLSANAVDKQGGATYVLDL